MNLSRAAFFENAARNLPRRDGADIDWKQGALGYLSQFIGTYQYDSV
jgi:hypothetical protein